MAEVIVNDVTLLADVLKELPLGAKVIFTGPSNKEEVAKAVKDANSNSSSEKEINVSSKLTKEGIVAVGIVVAATIAVVACRKNNCESVIEFCEEETAKLTEAVDLVESCFKSDDALGLLIASHRFVKRMFESYEIWGKYCGKFTNKVFHAKRKTKAEKEAGGKTKAEKEAEGEGKEAEGDE